MSPELAPRIEVVHGDITRLEVDAVVNAANPSLLGGGGVDGAIHRAAGPGLLEECRKWNARGGCPPGQARLTGGHGLPARWVIHTVGPVYHGGRQGEPQVLASCYRESLALARSVGADSVAFPMISCGVYGYPAREATAIAVKTVREELERHGAPGRVVFVGYSEGAAALLRAVLAEGAREAGGEEQGG